LRIPVSSPPIPSSRIIGASNSLRGLKKPKTFGPFGTEKCQKPDQKDCRGNAGITHTSAILNYAMSYQVFSGEEKILV
jgi:hypothetical protein